MNWYHCYREQHNEYLRHVNIDRKLRQIKAGRTVVVLSHFNFKFIFQLNIFPKNWWNDLRCSIISLSLNVKFIDSVKIIIILFIEFSYFIHHRCITWSAVMFIYLFFYSWNLKLKTILNAGYGGAQSKFSFIPTSIDTSCGVDNEFDIARIQSCPSIYIYFVRNLRRKYKKRNIAWNTRCSASSMLSSYCDIFLIKSLQIWSCQNKKLNMSFWNVARILLRSVCIQCLDMFFMFSIQLSIYAWKHDIWIVFFFKAHDGKFLNFHHPIDILKVQSYYSHAVNYTTIKQQLLLTISTNIPIKCLTFKIIWWRQGTSFSLIVICQSS